jgi:hypothetical protein
MLKPFYQVILDQPRTPKIRINAQTHPGAEDRFYHHLGQVTPLTGEVNIYALVPMKNSPLGFGLATRLDMKPSVEMAQDIVNVVNVELTPSDLIAFIDYEFASTIVIVKTRLEYPQASAKVREIRTELERFSVK